MPHDFFKRGLPLPELVITRGYLPGSIGRITELHGIYYSRSWKFGIFFEAKVASEMAAFLNRYDENRDGFWTVSVNGCIEGAIAIDGIHADSKGAHLRWFIVSETMRGKGAGNRLLEAAIAFCRNRGYRSVYLWTFDGLEAARHLYEKNGFELIEQKRGARWGSEVYERKYENRL
jgi:GNAT superfamily N-acetyltransferase